MKPTRRWKTVAPAACDAAINTLRDRMLALMSSAERKPLAVLQGQAIVGLKSPIGAKVEMEWGWLIVV